MDETGIMEGYGLNGYVVGNVEIRKIQGKQPGTRVWATIIECISATGESVLLLVIYKGKSVQQQHLSWRYSTIGTSLLRKMGGPAMLQLYFGKTTGSRT